MRSLDKVIGLALVLAVLPQSAHAYIDPGTAGMVLQLLIGGIAGAVVVFRHRLRQVVALFSRGNTKAHETRTSDGSGDSDKTDV